MLTYFKVLFLMAKFSLSPRQTTLLTVALFGVVFFIAYSFTIPALIASNYQRRLDDASSNLKDSFQKLVTIAGQFNAYGRDLDARSYNSDVEQAKNSLRQTQLALDKFQERANSLGSTLPTLSPGYKAARVEQIRARYIIGQSQDVLDEYKQVMEFAGALNQIAVQLKEVNSTALQLNRTYSLADQQAQAGQRAMQLQGLADQLKQHTVPPGFETAQTALLSTINQAKTGFEALSTSPTRLVDPSTDTNVQTIEAATLKCESGDSDLLQNLIDGSAAAKHVSELLDKIGFLTPETDDIHD
jgi:uncharacterized phage infection (PIP) family protein YhgE